MSSHFGSLKCSSNVKCYQCTLYTKIQASRKMEIYPSPRPRPPAPLIHSTQTTWHTEDAHKMEVLSIVAATEDTEDTWSLSSSRSFHSYWEGQGRLKTEDCIFKNSVRDYLTSLGSGKVKVSAFILKLFLCRMLYGSELYNINDYVVSEFRRNQRGLEVIWFQEGRGACWW